MTGVILGSKNDATVHAHLAAEAYVLDLDAERNRRQPAETISVFLDIEPLEGNDLNIENAKVWLY